jgi:hypothetical protein
MFFPAAFVEVGCLNVGFTLRGIHFRVMMGQIPQFYRTNCCLSSHRPIFYGDAAERTQQGYATIAALRERAPWLDEAD